MKHTLYIICFWCGIFVQAQVVVPFEFRKQESVKGGLKMIGNNILNKAPANTPYNGDELNDELDMRYIDIDTDATTFSSSAATLSLPNATCSKVRYAGLYWGAFYDIEDTTKDQIKFKIPSQTSYISLTADKYIYDYHTMLSSSRAHICYKDVTDIVSNGNPNGEYIVANVKTQQLGSFSAGWMLVIIYEDPLQTAKHITTFDGYASIYRSVGDVPFTFSGFKTLPSPLPVKARFGVAALEGDKGIEGDRLSIKKTDGTFQDLSTAVNPSNNFFNGSISEDDAIITNRRPASENTLGWDIDLFSIENAGNSVIGNGQVSAEFKAYSTQDRYDIFFSAFEVEVIEPKINLLKSVEDASGTILTKQVVPFGSTIYYGLEFQNVGNDDAVDYTITDILPKNVTLDTLIPIEIPTGSGITHSVTTLPDGSTQISFHIPNNLVAENSSAHKIRFAVKLNTNCADFQSPCSEIIANKAYSVYKGRLNNSIIPDVGSYSLIDTCRIGTIEDTIFYVDLSSCTLDIHITDFLCGENVTLTATSGFDKYEWKNSAGQIIGTTQSIIVSNSGVYSVTKTKGTCQPHKEIHTISALERQEINPLNAYAGEIFSCDTTQKSFPQIFLCGVMATKLIDLSAINNLASASWKKYNGTTIFPITQTCPPDDTHIWNVVSTQKSYTLSDEGIYSVSLTFNNGCVATYYFRVHTSPITPVITKEDVYCGVGKISVSGVSTDYEMALSKTNSGLTFQSSPDFILSEGGNYTLYIRKKVRLASDCVITNSISITASELKINMIGITNETCENLNDGSVQFSLSGGKSPYTASLKNLSSNTQQQLTGLVDATTYSFSNLAPAQYELSVSDSGVCTETETFTIKEVPSLRFTTLAWYGCAENKTYTELVVNFTNNDLNISDLKYTINGATTPKSFDRIQENTAYISQENLSSGENQSLHILYSNTCTFSGNFSVDIAQQLDFQKVTTDEISTIKIEASGGHGGYRYYFDDEFSDKPSYYLRSYNQGYIDANGNTIKQIKVRVEDRYGCYVERVIEEIFYDIEIPNYFTPNGDGINDFWFVKNAKAYPKMEISIFDRMGRILIKLTPFTQWNGKNKTTEMPSGDYWYIIRMNNAFERRTFKGHFTLYR